MVKRAPSRFNPDLLVRDVTRYEAEIPLSHFTRLSDQLLSSEGSLMATFSLSARGKHVVARGSLEFVAELQCQRCMQPFAHPIQANFELVCVKTQAEADSLPDALDPVVLDEDGQLLLIDLLEDDALLQLPEFPKHENDESCQPSEQSFGTLPDTVETAKPNPFGVLKDLKIN